MTDFPLRYKWWTTRRRRRMQKNKWGFHPNFFTNGDAWWSRVVVGYRGGRVPNSRVLGTVVTKLDFTLNNKRDIVVTICLTSQPLHSLLVLKDDLPIPDYIRQLKFHHKIQHMERNKTQ